MRLALYRSPRTPRAAIIHSGRPFSGGPPVGAPDPLDQNIEDDDKRGDDSDHSFKSTMYKMFEAAATTFASIAVLG